jgi:imidazolonepropionase-like amidohydrolase
MPKGAQVIDLPGQTLMPGLIEAHSQFCCIRTAKLSERSSRERVVELARRARDEPLRNTLQAGFTRFAISAPKARLRDVGLKQAVEQGIIPVRE